MHLLCHSKAAFPNIVLSFALPSVLFNAVSFPIQLPGRQMANPDRTTQANKDTILQASAKASVEGSAARKRRQSIHLDDAESYISEKGNDVRDLDYKKRQVLQGPRDLRWCFADRPPDVQRLDTHLARLPSDRRHLRRHRHFAAIRLLLDLLLGARV